MFPDFSDNLKDRASMDELTRSLAAILFSHRYDKKDKFILEQKELKQEINFGMIRDVMYKYSKKAQREFVSVQSNAFLLLNFVGTVKGKEFIDQKEKGIA